MPDSRAGPLLRLSGGSVVGVKWRPTQFVDGAAHRFACSLCGVISGTRTLLPCMHALCDVCNTGSGQHGTGGVCPLDKERFEEECVKLPLLAKKVDTFKAHCWNKEQGCSFVGTLAAILHHYEEECPFHTVDCLRCGGNVLHESLSEHYMSGCFDTGTSPTSTNQTPQGDGVAQTRDANAAFNEIRVLLRKPCEDYLPALQSQLNELTEQVTSQGILLRDIREESKERHRSEITAHAQAQAELSTALGELQSQLDELTSELCPTPEEEESWDRTTPIPWCLEKKHILRKLEVFANESLSRLYDASHAALPHVKYPIIWFIQRYPTSWVPTGGVENVFFDQWSDRSVVYQFAVSNFDEILSPAGSDRSLAELTLWHARDVHFTVAIIIDQLHDKLEVRFRFGSSLGGVPKVGVSSGMLSVEGGAVLTFSAQDSCDRRDNLFTLSLSDLRSAGFSEGACGTLVITIDKL